MYIKPIIAILILCFAFGVSWCIYKKFTSLKASQIVAQVFAVWAAQGPFENGEVSASSLRYATLAVRGMDSLDDKKSKEAISMHACAYDADPERWEALRSEYLSSHKNGQFKEQLEKANEIASNTIALQKFGKNLIEDTSKECTDLISFLRSAYKSRYEKDFENDGSIGFIYAQIYSESFSYPDEDFYRIFLKLNERRKELTNGAK